MFDSLVLIKVVFLSIYLKASDKPSGPEPSSLACLNLARLVTSTSDLIRASQLIVLTQVKKRSKESLRTWCGEAKDGMLPDRQIRQAYSGDRYIQTGQVSSGGVVLHRLCCHRFQAPIFRSANRNRTYYDRQAQPTA